MKFVSEFTWIDEQPLCVAQFECLNWNFRSPHLLLTYIRNKHKIQRILMSYSVLCVVVM